MGVELSGVDYEILKFKEEWAISDGVCVIYLRITGDEQNLIRQLETSHYEKLPLPSPRFNTKNIIPDFPDVIEMTENHSGYYYLEQGHSNMKLLLYDTTAKELIYILDII